MHYTKGRHILRAPWAFRARALLWVGALLIGVPEATAQIGPTGGFGPGGGPRPGGPDDKDKKEGVAEAAPKAAGLLPTTPALPAPKARRKRWKLLELDGYYRLRTDWFKNFNLGFSDTGAGGAPFVRPLGCNSAILGAPCDGSLSGTNMRLRLEPTINIDEGTAVHIQADLLDNLVLGSTPYAESLAGVYTTTPPVNPPLGAFGNGTQAAVSQGVNSDRSSIQIKRAWADVALPLGILKFGRMPNHWGMGIVHNSGGADPISGNYDHGGDYGDTVDRLSFSLLIPGTNLRAMIAADWPLTRLVSNQTSANTGNEGHPFNLDNSDDQTRYVGVISRMDSPQEFRDTVDRGETAFNYGVYFEYTTQAWDYDLRDFKLGGTPTQPVPADGNTVPQRYVPRNLKVYSPDVWAKLGIGPVTVEAELVAQLGSFEVQDLVIGAATTAPSTSYNVRKYGGSGRVTWQGNEGKLRLGLESGFASGDSWDNTPPGATNIAFRNQLGGPGDTTLSQFVFNRDYKVDLIMWRHLFGAVTNAAYVKPFLQYDLTKSITFKVSNVTSFALRKVATPGNGGVYGTEFDTDVGYASNGLFAGISYGVLFPLSAMSHPADPLGSDGKPTQTYGYTDYSGTTPNTSNVKDADTAHVIQTRFVLAF
jgi:uncharacterized protein (TIGR04551 family)